MNTERAAYTDWGAWEREMIQTARTWMYRTQVFGFLTVIGVAPFIGQNATIAISISAVGSVFMFITGLYAAAHQEEGWERRIVEWLDGWGPNLWELEPMQGGEGA